MDTYANFFDKHNKKMVETPVAIQGAQKWHKKWHDLDFPLKMSHMSHMSSNP